MKYKYINSYINMYNHYISISNLSRPLFEIENSAYYLLLSEPLNIFKMFYTLYHMLIFLIYQILGINNSLELGVIFTVKGIHLVLARQGKSGEDYLL